MNYGHPLEFGTFITPLNAEPDAVVELAVLSETLGYDLVTFQDHPYQPRFLDTWTLLSYAAARTHRITLATNVLNLPLRQPVIVARSAASLDRLRRRSAAVLRRRGDGERGRVARRTAARHRDRSGTKGRVRINDERRSD